MHFLGLSINILRYIGIFPLSTSSKWATWLSNVYRWTLFVLLVWIPVSMTVELFKAPDLSQLARIIDIWTLVWSGLYKWCYMALFYNDFIEFDTALTKVQNQGLAAHGRPSMANVHFTTNYIKKTRLFTLCYLLSGILAVCLITVNPLVTYPRSNRSDFDYYNDPKSYPLLSWMPFSVYNKWLFSTIFFSHFTVSMLYVLIYLGIDSFMFGAIYIIGGQINQLNSSIINIENSLKTENISCKDQLTSMYFTEEGQQIFHDKLRECLKHHILIMNYIKKLRTDFNTLIIVDYLHGITSLTFALFQMTITFSVEELITIVIFFLVSLSHQFLNNFFGEYILRKQLSVQYTLSDVPWWRTGKKIRFIFQLMILRSTKPTTITGFYLYNLCNSSFLSFVKTLYSYYMVLRRVHTEDNNA